MANVSGTEGDDVLGFSQGATNDNDNIVGLAGNDMIFGLDGADTLDGGVGNDTLFGGDGKDGLFGGDGIDTSDYYFSNAAVSINLAANAAVGGWAEGDTFSYVENLIGSQYSDNLIGNVLANQLVGEQGNDELGGGAGNDSLYGGAGNDSLHGGDDDDTLDGGAGNDVMLGGAGDDVIKGYAGADQLDGGEGYDAVDYSQSAAGVVVSLADGIGSGGDAEGDTLIGIEWLAGSKFADTLTGNDADNVLVGSFSFSGGNIDDGDDTLNGLGGNDLLTGGGGNDALDGGAGNDSLGGGYGNDLLDGGVGADYMAGGAGDDTYMVDDAGDVVDELDGPDTGIDTVQSTVSFSFVDELHAYGNFEHLTLIGDADIDGTGNNLANIIVGNSGNNVLTGGGGNDTLDGGAGRDQASYADKTGSVVVTLNGATDVTVFVNGIAEDKIRNIEGIIGGSGNDSLTGDVAENSFLGGAGDDLLLGMDGADVLDGGDGSDRLSGGNGADQMTGGTGGDSFAFDAALNKTTNVDAILDFSSLDDTIVLDNAIFAKLKTEGVLKGKFFHEGKKAHDGNDRIIYNEKNGKLVYDENGDKKGGKVTFATLDSGLDLSAADFLVI